MKLNMEKLKNIASIRTGVLGKATSEGNIKYIQVRDFDSVGKKNTEIFEEINGISIKDRHFLKKGDVLFSAKGTKNFASEVDISMLPAVASTSMFIISVNDNIVLPEYLTWYLNQPKVISYLKRKAKGTSMPSISKKDLGELEIAIPRIKVQDTILKIEALRKKKRKIVQRIEKLSELYMETIIFNKIN